MDTHGELAYSAEAEARDARFALGRLATLFPDIAAQWDAERNGSLRPDQVTSFSNRKVWWLCPEGHVWHTAISNRTNAKKRTGYPVCAGNVSQKHRHLHLSPQADAERRRA